MAPTTIVAPTQIEMIPMDQIDPSPDNVRKELGDVSELAASIKERGLIHNPALAKLASGRYVIVAGHRRIAALKSLGLTQVPATVRTQNGAGAGVIDAIVENLQREGVTPMDEARAYNKLAVEYGVKQREIAKQTGVSQPHVSKRLALVDLPEEVQDAIDAGGINVNDALALLELKDNPETLIRVFNNRGKGNINFLISQVKAAEAKRAEKDAQPEPSEEDLTKAKDAASKRRLLTKQVKQADETRGKAITSLLKSRMAKGKMLDWTLNRLIEMVPVEMFDLACAALGIEKINDPNGFGQIYDVNSFFAKNEDDNHLRLGLAIGLVRGHQPLMGAREVLKGKDRLFAESTLEYLAEHGNYTPLQGEQVLIGKLDIGVIEPPPKPPAKPKLTDKEKAAAKLAAKAKRDEAKAKKGTSKDTNSALEHQTDERDDTKVETLPMAGAVEAETQDGPPAGHIVCPTCEGTGTDGEETCGTCDGTGWVEAAETEE